MASSISKGSSGYESKGRRHELITLAAVACDYAVGKADD
jgi:hypothetical protein